MFNNIYNRQITGKCNKTYALRYVIMGNDCYKQMWTLTDKFMSNDKTVYLISKDQQLDDIDAQIIRKYDIIMLICNDKIDYLKPINHLMYKGERFDISDVNLCYVSQRIFNYSKEWEYYNL